MVREVEANDESKETNEVADEAGVSGISRVGGS